MYECSASRKRSKTLKVCGSHLPGVTKSQNSLSSGSSLTVKLRPWIVMVRVVGNIRSADLVGTQKKDSLARHQTTACVISQHNGSCLSGEDRPKNTMQKEYRRTVRISVQRVC